MSYVPPEPRDPFNTRLDRAQEQIGREEAFAAEQRLAREAQEATGGTPMEKLWRRLKGLLGTEDPPSGG